VGYATIGLPFVKNKILERVGCRRVNAREDILPESFPKNKGQTKWFH
jgi:hypothetical protein